jgi:hypothetical protein
MIKERETVMQTFRVDIDLDSEGTLAEFLDLLSEHGSPRIVSYDAAPDAGGCPTMVLEFTSYEDALAFAQRWFGESAEDAKEYVETITV